MRIQRSPKKARMPARTFWKMTEMKLAVITVLFFVEFLCQPQTPARHWSIKCTVLKHDRVLGLLPITSYAFFMKS